MKGNVKSKNYLLFLRIFCISMLLRGWKFKTVEKAENVMTCRRNADDM